MLVLQPVQSHGSLRAQPRRTGAGDVKQGSRATTLSQRELAELSQLVPDPKTDELFDPGTAAPCQRPPTLRVQGGCSHACCHLSAAACPVWNHRVAGGL